MTWQNRYDEINPSVHQLALGLLLTMDAQQCFSGERCVEEIFLWPIKDLVLITESFVGFLGSFFPGNFIQDSLFLCETQMPPVASLTQLASCSHASAGKKEKEWQPPELTGSHGQQFPAAEMGKKNWKHFSQNKLSRFIYMPLGEIINSILDENLAFLNFCQHICSTLF